MSNLYVRTDGGVVTRFPYTKADLRFDEPRASFPAQMSDADAAVFGVFPVTESARPAYNPASQRLERSTPTNENGQWVQGWAVVALTPQEIEAQRGDLADNVRYERNQRISDFEPRILRALRLQRMGQQHEDIAVLDAYVQALADVPAQAGFPWDVQWPSVPE